MSAQVCLHWKTNPASPLSFVEKNMKRGREKEENVQEKSGNMKNKVEIEVNRVK